MFKTCYQGHLQLILAKDSKPTFRTKTASLWKSLSGRLIKMQRSARYEKQFNAKNNPS